MLSPTPELNFAVNAAPDTNDNVVSGNICYPVTVNVLVEAVAAVKPIPNGTSLNA